MTDNVPVESSEGGLEQRQRFDRSDPTPEVMGIRQGLWGIRGSGDTTGFGGLVQEVTLPGESARPYGGWFDSVVDILEELITEEGMQIGEVIERVVVDRDELTIFITRKHIVHYPQNSGRELHAVYHLMSVTHNRNLRLEVTCPDTDPHIPSVVSIYPGNDWHERETWDLFGIIFTGHPGLTRTAMPDDWVGHPQRKDYPLGGIPVEYKGATVPPPDTRRSYN